VKYCSDCKSLVERKTEFVQTNTTGTVALAAAIPLVLSSSAADPNTDTPLGVPIQKTYWHCKNPECGSIEIIE